MRYSLLFLLLVACSDGSRRPPPAATAPEPPPVVADAAPAVACGDAVFAVDLPISEASGAAYLAASDGRPARVLVVGDSGNHGPWLELAADDGRVLGSGTLPLDGAASDDLEGLAVVGDRVYAVTSSGYLRSWRRDGDGFAAVDAAYPVAEPGHGDPPITCNDGRKVNCGSNIEGLCLRDPRPTAGCAGYLVAKTTGRLVCLRWSGDRLTATAADGIAVSGPGVLAGCAFTPEGRLLVGANLFAADTVWEVPAKGPPRAIGQLGPGFAEAIAAGPNGAIFRFSDTGSAPSAAKKFVCR